MANSKKPNQPESAMAQQPPPKHKSVLRLLPFFILAGVFAVIGLSQTGYITLPKIGDSFGESGVYKISPDATVGVPASYEFSELISFLGPESGASPAIYTYYLGSGVGFPPMGLVLGIDGVLKGTPRVKGTSEFQVCVRDVGGRSACRKYSLTVNPAGLPVKPGPGPKCFTTSAQWGIACRQGGVSGLPIPDSCDCPSDTFYSGTTDRVTPGGPYKICMCK